MSSISKARVTVLQSQKIIIDRVIKNDDEADNISAVVQKKILEIIKEQLNYSVSLIPETITVVVSYQT